MIVCVKYLVIDFDGFVGFCGYGYGGNGCYILDGMCGGFKGWFGIYIMVC